MTKDKYKLLTDLIVEAKVGDSLDKAINYLSSTVFSQELILLKSRFEKNEKEKRMNTIEKDSYAVEFNKITVSLLSILKNNKSLLEESTVGSDFTPEISFDYEFNHFESFEELMTILNECEYNLNNDVSPICKVSFPLEDVLLFEINKGAKRHEVAAIKNVISKINKLRKIVLEVIELILTKYIHYNFQDNKKQQAVALRNVLNGIKQSGVFNGMYLYASRSGIELTELTIWESMKENKANKQGDEVILNGTMPASHTKVDVYNNESNPKIVHSIWLNSDEMKEFEDNLSKDADFGKRAKEIMYMFLGGDFFSATAFLPQKVIFEKLIPKAILNTYHLKVRGTVDEKIIDKTINIDNLYVGIG